MLNFFLTSPWPGLAVWTLLYISDYAFTLTCARLYRKGVCEKMVFEGSYEITPYFQKDIDALKPISSRFLWMLFLSNFFLAWVWFLTVESMPGFYPFALGSLILAELVVHLRHLRNLFMFREMIASDSVRGRIEYSRPFMLRTSSRELFAFSALFLVLCLFIPSWFLVGGALKCFSTGVQHLRLSRKASSKTDIALQTQST